MSENVLERLKEQIEEEEKEKHLTKIPLVFYRNIAQRIKEIDGEMALMEPGLKSRLLSKEKDVLANLTLRLVRLRIDKALDLGSEGLGSLTTEEKYVVEAYGASKRRMERVERAIKRGHTAFLETIANLVASRYVTVRFLKPSPPFTGVDLHKYGPFSDGDVATVPADNAYLLTKEGYAEEVWMEEP